LRVLGKDGVGLLPATVCLGVVDAASSALEFATCPVTADEPLLGCVRAWTERLACARARACGGLSVAGGLMKGHVRSCR
jgi:hypothetical protein